MDFLLSEVRKVLNAKARVKFERDLKRQALAQKSKIKIQSSRVKKHLD